MNELDNTFVEIAMIIEEARDNAYRKVNEELILMYQRVGQFLSEKSKEANYGDGYVDSLADYISKYDKDFPTEDPKAKDKKMNKQYDDERTQAYLRRLEEIEEEFDYDYGDEDED